MNHKQTAGRFAIVGVANTLLDFGVLFTLTSLGVNKLVANVISTTIAFIFSFFANKKFTFKSTSKSLVREMILFVIVTLFGLWGLQTGVIWATTPLLTSVTGSESLGLLGAKLVATAVSMVWNYLLYSKLVFRSHA